MKLSSQPRGAAADYIAPGGSRLHIESVGRSHVGRVREINEDRFGVFDDIGLYAVADGIGGEVCGEIAAQIAIDTVALVVASGGKPGWAANFPNMALLIEAARVANEHILAAADANPNRHGMGTTFAGVLTRGEYACIAHVGDSRVYRLRNGELTRLTDDHTVFATAVRQGIPPHRAQLLPSAGALMRSLGTVNRAGVDARMERAVAGDILLICTDGICGVLDDGVIRKILSSPRDLDAMADRLVELANDEGGPDNATCVLVRWSESPDAPESGILPSSKRNRGAD